MASQIVSVTKSDRELGILNHTPDYYRNVLCKLRVCHDLCVYSRVPILGPEVKGKIEQCSVDFRHISIQTATLAERIGSNWCRTCIIFFEKISEITSGQSGKVKLMTKISVQAKEFSMGFKQIAEWIRDLAGEFHDCQELAGKDRDEYVKQVDEAKRQAERAELEAREKREAARKKLEANKKSARVLGICAFVPVVRLVAIPGYIVARGKINNAKRDEDIACEASQIARDILEKAENAQKEAEIAAEHIKNLILALKQVEEICEAQAAFWNFQSDKFGSFSAQINDASDLMEVGIVDESIDKLIDWLKDRRRELETYHEVMQGVNSSYNFPCSVKPRKTFPKLDLPAIDIVLQ